MSLANPFLQSGPAAVRQHNVLLAHGPAAWSPPDRTATRASAMAAAEMFVAPDAGVTTARFAGVPEDVDVMVTPRSLPILEAACWSGRRDPQVIVDHSGPRM